MLVCSRLIDYQYLTSLYNLAKSETLEDATEVEAMLKGIFELVEVSSDNSVG